MIEDLAVLIEAIDEAAKSADALPALLSTLRKRQSGLFAEAVLLRAGCGRGSFVVVGGDEFPGSSRTWMRWPLRRLFARMKPSRITNPCLPDQHALAIPFAYDAERYVVLASLTDRARGEPREGFFTILERVTVPRAEHVELASSEIPATPMEPMIAGLGLCDDLYERISQTLGRRGWELERLSGFAELWNRLQYAVPDVLVVDLEVLDAPVAAMLGIHRAADSSALRVLAFGDERFNHYGAEAVIDRVLPHAESPETIFKAFKELARDASLLRRAHAEDADIATQRYAHGSLTPDELARLGAQRAAEIMHGWSCCVLLGETGNVSRAEYPERTKPVFSRIPKSFLGEAYFDLRVGDGFLSEVTDQAAERMALLALKPLSGAALPIVSESGERYGVLVACSLHRWADSAAFEALKRLARHVAARHGALKPARVVIPEFRQERHWERLQDRGFGIDVYRSSDCRIPWRYRTVSDTTGLLTLGVDDDGALRRLTERETIKSGDMVRHLISIDGGTPAFAAAIDFTNESMTYAAHGFTPPISLVARGPMGSVESERGVSVGTAALPSPGEAAIFNTGLWHWLNARDKSEHLRPLLEKENPSGVASIVRLGSSPP